MFPFVYEGETYNLCSYYDVANPGVSWCGVTEVVFADFAENETHLGHKTGLTWGNCANSCGERKGKIIYNGPIFINCVLLK